MCCTTVVQMARIYEYLDSLLQEGGDQSREAICATFSAESLVWLPLKVMWNGNEGSNTTLAHVCLVIQSLLANVKRTVKRMHAC